MSRTERLKSTNSCPEKMKINLFIKMIYDPAWRIKAWTRAGNNFQINRLVKQELLQEEVIQVK